MSEAPSRSLSDIHPDSLHSLLLQPSSMCSNPGQAEHCTELGAVEAPIRSVFNGSTASVNVPHGNLGLRDCRHNDNDASIDGSHMQGGNSTDELFGKRLL